MIYLQEKYDKSAVKVSDAVQESSLGDRVRRGAKATPVKLPVSKRSRDNKI